MNQKGYSITVKDYEDIVDRLQKVINESTDPKAKAKVQKLLEQFEEYTAKWLTMDRVRYPTINFGGEKKLLYEEIRKYVFLPITTIVTFIDPC
jgi:hypothetical protein